MAAEEADATEAEWVELRMLTYADVCGRMLTYAHGCSRMLTDATDTEWVELRCRAL